MKTEKILDEDYNKIIAQVLKNKRLEKGYTLSSLAKHLNSKVTRQALARYENNTARIKMELFFDICKLYNENPGDVLEEISLKYMQYVMSNKNEDDEDEDYEGHHIRK